MPAGSTRPSTWLYRRWVQIALIAIVAAVMLAAAPTLVRLPDYPARRAAALRDGETLRRAGLSADARLALEKDLLLYETDSRIKIWTAIVQAIGGAALLVGLLFTWRNLRATHHKLDIDREQQLTSRFTAATSQLGAQLGDGKPNIEARLGGIYALASIARDSPRDYWPVMEILTAYVRHNVHGHALVVDGVFAEDDAGGLRFHAAPPPTDEDIDEVLATIARRVDRLLARRGVVEHDAAGDGDPWSEREPVLAGLSAASVQGRLVLGARPGAKVCRYGSSPELAAAVPMRGPCHAHHNGFDLHAGLVVPARDRARLERTCRYALRPPVADDRIRLTETGQVLLELRDRWRDGTTHLRFEPVELLERLAALTPRPRINLVLYYGVLAARAAWRSRLTGTDGAGTGPAQPPPSTISDSQGDAAAPTGAPRQRSNLLWAQLMARSSRLRQGFSGPRQSASRVGGSGTTFWRVPGVGAECASSR